MGVSVAVLCHRSRAMIVVVVTMFVMAVTVMCVLFRSVC